MSAMLKMPAPCAEKWSAMPASGFDCRFCASCQKHIIDFTQKSDADILAHLRKNQGGICGRFRPEQLNRPLIGAQAQRRVGLAAVLAGFTTLLAAQQPMQGQKAPEIVIEAEQMRTAQTEEKIIVPDSLITISGKVMDLETQEVLIGCTVLFEGTKFGTVSDANGLFVFSVPASLFAKSDCSLAFSYTGYLPQIIQLPAEISSNCVQLDAVKLSSFYSSLSGMVGVIVFTAKPTFKQRLRRFFHLNN